MGAAESFEKKVKGLKDYIALATVTSKNYQKTNLEIVKHLTQQGIPGVYVTLNKPYQTMNELFGRKRIDAKLIIFIDAVTKTVGGNIKKTRNCLYIGNPENLSDISLAMDQAVRALGNKEKFLFFDSLSTLLIYNKVNTVARFIHFISGKMRIWRVKGIIISLQKDKDEELIDELSQFCDVMIKF
ncbi:hypothetical protein HYX17_04735 [Candidatus Woesearchaeota archaeon]|nr:hypothetical protein [Candidatus Woesearchaeota archaeon]